MAGHSWGSKFVFLQNGTPSKPLKYSSGKTQEDVYEEIKTNLETEDVLIYESQPGTGKTIVLLNLVRIFGDAVFATTTNVLSEQYRQDYEHAVPGVSIGYMMGRANFNCLFVEGVSCNFKKLPCIRRLSKKERRKDVGAECPHFAFMCGSILSDEEEYEEIYPDYSIYDALDSSRYGVINWGRKSPCGFYSQFRYYVDKNVIVQNFSLFRLEVLIGRLPSQRLVVIDEGDEFLSNLTLKTTITERRIRILEREGWSLANDLTEKENKLLGELFDEVYKNFYRVLELEGFFSLSDSPIAEFYASLVNYLKRLDTDKARSLLSRLLWLGEFSSAIAYVEEYETYTGKTSKRVTFCVPEPAVVLSELFERLGVGSGTKIVFCSGTFPQEDVLQDVYGLRNYAYVVGERKARGKVIPCINLRYSVEMNHGNWERSSFRRHYFSAFLRLLNRMERPGVVLVHSYKYLPEGVEVSDDSDVARFKRGEVDLIISAKIRRGVDFPNAKSILFQRFPYPDMQSPEIQILKHKMKPEIFWKFYYDRAMSNFIQSLGRCTRREDQTVRVYSPDIKCFEVLSDLRDIFEVVE